MSYKMKGLLPQGHQRRLCLLRDRRNGQTVTRDPGELYASVIFEESSVSEWSFLNQ